MLWVYFANKLNDWYHKRIPKPCTLCLHTGVNKHNTSTHLKGSKFKYTVSPKQTRMELAHACLTVQKVQMITYHTNISQRL